MKCPICKTKKTQILHPNFPGYINPSDYEIYLCKKCDIQFISTKNISSELYNIIYGKKDTPGYYRYYNYAKKIKDQKNPLKYLSKQEPSYFPTYQFLKNTSKKLKILEVGCGYGYLTYSLNKRGHNALGIDISKRVIDFAKSKFGDYYVLSSIENLKIKEKFDLIVANELIEHLDSPSEFINKCKNLLKPSGHIIITTPNKDYYPKKSVWKTDLPPVHTVWLSKKSIEYLAKEYDLQCHFVNFSKYICKKENILVSYLVSRIKSSKLPLPVIDMEGKPIQERVNFQNSNLRKTLRFVLLAYPLRISFHYFHYLITSESPTIGAIIKNR